MPFYRDVLGLTRARRRPRLRRASTPASGTQLSDLQACRRSSAATPSAHFEVTDIEATVADIRSRGGVFEEYTSGALVTVNGIAQFGPTARGAWLKDPDGNVIGMRQGPSRAAETGYLIRPRACPPGEQLRPECALRLPPGANSGSNSTRGGRLCPSGGPNRPILSRGRACLCGDRPTCSRGEHRGGYLMSILPKRRDATWRKTTPKTDR